MQHTPPYALVLVFARGTLCRCQGAYCSEVTVVHTADRSGPMCTPIGADDGREKSAPQTRSQRYHAWCALFVGCPARTQAGCAPAVGSPKRNYNCTGHKLPLSFSGASTTRGREKQRRGRIHWPPKHRFLATLQHSGAYRRTCTTPPVARPACGAPACFFFLPPPAACVCIKRGNKRKKKKREFESGKRPTTQTPAQCASHARATVVCAELSRNNSVSCSLRKRCTALCAVSCGRTAREHSIFLSCNRLAWGAAPSECRNTSPAPARARPPPPALLMGIYWNILRRRRGRTDVRMCTSGTPYLCYYFARQYPPAQCLRSTFTQGPALCCSVSPPRSAPWVSPGEMLMQEVVP